MTYIQEQAYKQTAMELLDTMSQLVEEVRR